MHQLRTWQLTIGFLITVVLSVVCLKAQDPVNSQITTAPPPLKTISREEKSLLDQLKDVKSRLRKAIELAENHLTVAEEHTDKRQYGDASAELGKYWALIEDSLTLLSPLDHDRNKTRDLYKRLELALRGHAPRLTAMRRTTPLEYAYWIKEVEDFARNGRTEALNSFYGHTVVREAQSRPTPEKTPDKRRDSSLVPPASKQP